MFPTDKVITFPGGDSWHYKSDPKARVLACLDQTQFCDPDGDECWPAKPNWDDHLRPPGYWLMKLALKDSSIYDSIALRLGAALVAQEMIAQQLSLPLPDQHWMTEARRMFATSLALAQINAWSIASGEDQVHEGLDGWENQTPEEAGNLCGLLKFKSAGYTDIDKVTFFLLLFIPYPAAFILSLKWKSVRPLRRGGNNGDTNGGNTGESSGEANGGDGGRNHEQREGSNTTNGQTAAAIPAAGTVLSPEHNEIEQDEDPDERIVLEIITKSLFTGAIFLYHLCRDRAKGR